MSDELKPCPFCGGEAEFISGVGFFCVSCSFCCGETNLYNTGQEAIDAWNRRIEPTFTPDELDAIRRIFECRYPRPQQLSAFETTIINKAKAALRRKQ